MRRFSLVLFLVAPVFFAGTGSLWAQKKPLDHDVYDSWQAVSGTVLSPSGKVISYAVNPQEGDGTLFIRMTEKKGARTLEIPRGYQVRLTDNDRYAVCLIKPEFQKTRRARIKKLTGNKLPQDSLAVIDLTSGTIVRKFPNVKSFQMGLHATEQFAFSTVDTRGPGHPAPHRQVRLLQGRPHPGPDPENGQETLCRRFLCRWQGAHVHGHRHFPCGACL